MDGITDNTLLNSLSMTTRQQEKTAAVGSENELGQSAFLELMIAQLKNQDPLDPQENSAFVAQLAQFSSVEGIDKLNNSFDSFAANAISNQALQASALVGSAVAVPATSADLDQGGFVGGNFNVPSASGDVSVNIFSESGELLESIQLGAQPPGEISFRWDGTRIEVNGQLDKFRSTDPIESGRFRFDVLATQNGEVEQLDTALTANVNSVTVNANNQLMLNLAGVGQVNLSEVKQFN
jgi:flagellar basal-body rod modification protein FlgD